MSSPITFSGFNDIDFNTVLNALMTQASQPLTTLETRQDALKSQLTTFDTLEARIDSLRTAAASLASADSISTMAGTSSDTAAVTVATSNAAAPSHLDVVVTSLARAQVTPSTETFADADTTIVASSGTLTIGGVAVTIAGDTTLAGLASAINATADIGVQASVVRTGPDGFRLALTSTMTGTEHAFTVTNALAGGAGISFGTNAVTASDAAILVNNIAATSSSNTFEDVVPGVSLTVHRVDPDAPIGVDVAADSGALTAKVEAFVDSYNDTVAFLDAQRVSAGAGDATSIGSDPLLRQLRTGLRSELLGAHGSALFTRLSEVGVEFTRTGQLEIDRDVFDEAVAQHGDEVRDLFAGASGAFPAVETMLESYTTAAGLLSTVKDRLNTQIASMDRQILAMQSRLALQRDALQRQFTEADAAMSRLKSQSSSLAGIGGAF